MMLSSYRVSLSHILATVKVTSPQLISTWIKSMKLARYIFLASLVFPPYCGINCWYEQRKSQSLPDFALGMLIAHFMVSRHYVFFIFSSASSLYLHLFSTVYTFLQVYLLNCITNQLWENIPNGKVKRKYLVQVVFLSTILLARITIFVHHLKCGQKDTMLWKQWRGEEKCPL